MTSILDGELAGLIGDALADAELTLDVVLTRTVYTPGPNPWDPPTSTTVNYSCSGFVDEFDASWRAGGLVLTGDVRIVVIATTLAVEPQPGDTVTVRGDSYTVISVSTDPARALWSLQGRA